MIVKQIVVGGKSYPVCFSARVLLALEVRGGDADQELSRILTSRKLEDMFWLLHQMVDAGRRWADLEGEDHPGPLSLDALVDSMAVDELGSLFSAVTGTIAEDSKPTVEAVPGKNAEATPGD